MVGTVMYVIESRMPVERCDYDGWAASRRARILFAPPTRGGTTWITTSKIQPIAILHPFSAPE